MPFQLQSLLHSHCQSQTNLSIQCQSITNPRQLENNCKTDKGTSQLYEVRPKCLDGGRSPGLITHEDGIQSQSDVHPVPMRFLSGANPMSTLCKCDANPKSIQYQSRAQSKTTNRVRHPTAIQCQCDANLVPIHHPSIPI